MKWGPWQASTVVTLDECLTTLPGGRLLLDFIGLYMIKRYMLVNRVGKNVQWKSS